jgi:DNA-binding XRE family transcriptional regulator
MREIGPTLKRAREDAHLTQEAVAKMIGVSVWTYNRLERGYRNWDDAILHRLPAAMRPQVARFLSDRYTQRLRALQRVESPGQAPAQRAETPGQRQPMRRLAPVPAGATAA